MLSGDGVFGGAKAGAPFDPVTFAKKPPVILRGCCLLFAIVVFGCISSAGWKWKGNREKCVFNDDGSACNYGVGIGVIAFLASIALLAGEYLFEQMSSVKSRKHYVLGDLAFSGLWTLLFFIAFCYLAKQWSATNAADLPSDVSTGKVKAAIFFSFLSTGVWGACAFLAFQRFQQGSESVFAPSYDVDSGAMPGATAYQSFPGGADEGVGGYQQSPFQSSGPGMNYAQQSY